VAAPKYSILLASRNEGSSLRKTVESICANSPSRTSSNSSLSMMPPAMTVVPFSRNRNSVDCRSHRPERRARGLIFSRARAAALAAGQYLIFLDAHCAVAPNWLAALEAALESIDGQALRFPPSMSSVRVLGHRLRQSGGGRLFLGTPFLDFCWAEPFEVEGKLCTCTMGGGAWMCARAWYEQLGGLDRGMRYWGGENVDFPLRTWVAGGYCLVAPASAIGHYFKENPANPTSGPTITYNKIRAATRSSPSAR